jgi:molecular chaperone HtpG
MDKVEFTVQTQAMGEEQLPVIITQSEYMRRMKDMARLQPGMQFYGEMPDMYNLVLNTDSLLVKELLDTENNERISQLIDLALLQNGMLSGEALTKFVKRSVGMIK